MKQKTAATNRQCFGYNKSAVVWPTLQKQNRQCFGMKTNRRTKSATFSAPNSAPGSAPNFGSPSIQFRPPRPVRPSQSIHIRPSWPVRPCWSVHVNLSMSFRPDPSVYIFFRPSPPVQVRPPQGLPDNCGNQCSPRSEKGCRGKSQTESAKGCRGKRQARSDKGFSLFSVSQPSPNHPGEAGQKQQA